ncbi:MAG: aldo/keto reductase [Planctomycetota bacterium]
MERRRLGQSDLEIPSVTFGAWAIGGTMWGGSDDELAVAAIQAALEVGLVAIDTAPVYGFGRSERVVGRALAGGRAKDAIVLTKAGLRWDSDDGQLAFEGPDETGTVRKIYFNSRPESVREECDASLARLGIERIDLFQIHWPDPTTPIAETMGALVDLIAAGKVRAVGVSNFSPAQMTEARDALGDVPLASDQPKYSLVARDIEHDVLPYAREHDVGLIVYSPIEQGLLSGKVTAARTFEETDNRSRRPTFRPVNRALVNGVLNEVVQPIAAEHGATLAQTVIAWTIAQPGITSAIVGARNPEQVRENARAAELELTASDLDAIDQAFRGLPLDVA